MSRSSDPPNAHAVADLIRLTPRDRLRQDEGQRERHLRTMEDDAWSKEQQRIHEETAFRLTAVKQAYDRFDFPDLEAAARRLRKLGVQSGLPDVARAADHILDAMAQRDTVALGATVARMLRLGQMALDLPNS